MRFADFVSHEKARKAGLSRAHVLALRLYTTEAFRIINNPLRDQERYRKGKPHPLPATVVFLREGIKRLRACAGEFENDDESESVLATAAQEMKGKRRRIRAEPLERTAAHLQRWVWGLVYYGEAFERSI